jgi:hypothetical protein
VAVVVLLLAAACGDQIHTGATSSTLPASTVAGEPATTMSLPPAAAAIRIQADGLSVVAIGATRDETVGALTTALGSATASAKGCELAGADATTVSWRELAVQFVGGRFHSYTVRPPPRETPVLRLRTPEGAAIGTTVATLRTTYGSRLAMPGLPAQFGGRDFRISFPGTSRTLLGTLTAASDDGRVTSFFTSTCE